MRCRSPAATAAIDDQAWLAANRAKILATRGAAGDGMRELGFAAVDSQANFVWSPHPDVPVKPLYERLKADRILVRYMDYPGWGDGLRISVGTDEQIDACLGLLKRWYEIGLGCTPCRRAMYDVSLTTSSTTLHRMTMHAPPNPTQDRRNRDRTGAEPRRQRQRQVATGVGFFDHMLTLLAKHAAIDLTVRANGDLHVDQHHTVEDVGICLGQALRQALGDKAGIRRYGHFTLPMEETLVTSAIDLSGRYFLVFQAAIPAAQDRRVRQRAGRGFLAGRGRQRPVQPARRAAPRPQQPSHQRSDLQGHGPSAAHGRRARSAHPRRAQHQGDAGWQNGMKNSRS